MRKEEFLKLVERHRHEFCRYVRRMAWDSGMTDDVFASAVLAAFENRHKFTPGTNFRAWMYRILTNKCYVANRETKRAMEPLDAVEPNLVAMDRNPGYGDVLRDPSAFLEQCGDEVNQALSHLSLAERSCILLRAAEKFSYREIADILEMPVGTVMTHLSRGRAKLRKELLVYAQERGFARAYPRLVQRNTRKTLDGPTHEALG